MKKFLNDERSRLKYDEKENCWLLYVWRKNEKLSYFKNKDKKEAEQLLEAFHFLGLDLFREMIYTSQCVSCGKVLVKEKKSGQRLSRCSACATVVGYKASRNWVNNNRDKARETNTKNAAKLRKNYPKKALINKARERARKAGVPFNLKPEDFQIPEVCPILKIRLEVQTGKKVAAECSPTLDRIIPELGYVPENVQVISMKANTMKSNATILQLKLFAKWIETL